MENTCSLVSLRWARYILKHQIYLLPFRNDDTVFLICPTAVLFLDSSVQKIISWLSCSETSCSVSLLTKRTSSLCSDMNVILRDRLLYFGRNIPAYLRSSDIECNFVIELSAGVLPWFYALKYIGAGPKFPAVVEPFLCLLHTKSAAAIDTAASGKGLQGHYHITSWYFYPL